MTAAAASAASGRVIAVLGAPGTGRTTLVQALAAHAASRPGWSTADVGMVPEALRLFRDRRGRPPTPDELHAIAAEQAWRIAEAASAHRLVFADTTAVMPAVRHRFESGDRALEAAAIATHRAVDHTLVTALDLPWAATPSPPDGPHVREPIDRLLRALLREGGVPFGVVHGQGPLRLQAAWRALAPVFQAWGFEALAADDGVFTRATDPAGDADTDLLGAPLQHRRWQAICACCGDPEGEAAELHRLRSRRPRP
jgi:nicotinamide riboside kinase